ncbi:hypothetical protein BC629DRAFT_55684 [Irpex lacteus]|nr:hypothetical protein BC629DRAFT_55684 [Irpex lacteus]
MVRAMFAHARVARTRRKWHRNRRMEDEHLLIDRIYPQRLRFSLVKVHKVAACILHCLSCRSGHRARLSGVNKSQPRREKPMQRSARFGHPPSWTHSSSSLLWALASRYLAARFGRSSSGTTMKLSAGSLSPPNMPSKPIAQTYPTLEPVRATMQLEVIGNNKAVSMVQVLLLSRRTH